MYYKDRKRKDWRFVFLYTSISI